MRNYVPIASLLLLFACNSEAPLQVGELEGAASVDAPLTSVESLDQAYDPEVVQSGTFDTAPLDGEPLMLSTQQIAARKAEAEAARLNPPRFNPADGELPPTILRAAYSPSRARELELARRAGRLEVTQ